MGKTRIGLIGAGGIARYHLRHLERMEDVAVTAVTDVDAERAKAIADQTGAAVFADHRALLTSGAVDAVFICVPPFAHEDQELLAAANRIPFFTEKPQALSMELANRVEKAVREAGIVTAVGFQDRYQDTFDRLRAYLQGRRVGLMWGSWVGGMPSVPWWRRKEMSGGQHIEQTIHIFDSARYLLGEVTRVSAAAATTDLMADVENYNVEDASAVTLYFESGAVGTIFSACYLKVGRAGKSGLEIFTQDARIEYRLRHSVTYHEKDQVREELRMNDNGFDCDRTFIEAVQAGDPSRVRSPYADANKSLAIVLAADEPMRRGGQVVEVGEVARRAG